jgi:uncharacterized protein YbjT (DUF2867 family)
MYEKVILVSGSTGRQGGAVVRELLKEQWHVKALTRNRRQDAARELADSGAEVVQYDPDSQVEVESLMQDAYGVFSMQKSQVEDVDAEVRQGKAMAEAARKMNVQHFVYSSAGGAERAAGVHPQEQKYIVEQHIKDLGLPATILRPVSFMENYAEESMKRSIEEGVIIEPLSPGTTLQRISVDDVARFTVLAFKTPESFLGRVLEIAGDERTMQETAEAFGKWLQRPVEYKMFPLEEFQRQFGEERARMFQWLDEEGFNADLQLCRRLHPDLSNLDDWIKKTF